MPQGRRRTDALAFSDEPSRSARMVASGWRENRARRPSALEACRNDGDRRCFSRSCGSEPGLLDALACSWTTLAVGHGREAAEVKELIDILGHDNDLAVLCDLPTPSRSFSRTAGSAGMLYDALDCRQRATARRSLEDGRRRLRRRPPRQKAGSSNCCGGPHARRKTSRSGMRQLIAIAWEGQNLYFSPHDSRDRFHPA